MSRVGRLTLPSSLDVVVWFARRVLVGAVLVALLGGIVAVVVVAGAQPPAVAQEPSDGGSTLLVDEAAARAEAEATGEPVVVESLTTENQLVKAVPGVEGLNAEITALPARVRRNDEWFDIDETLQLDAELGRLAPVAVPVSFSVSADGSGPLVEMTSAAGESLSLSWPEELPELPDPVLDGNLATWPGVLPDVDLVVGSYSGGFSTYVVLHTPEAAALPELADLGFDMSTEGLTVTTDDRGRISAANSSGAVVFKTHLPQQWDAGEPAPGEVLTAEEKLAVDRAKRAAEATMESTDTSSDLRDLLDGPAGSRVSTMGLELQPEGASEAARSSSADEDSSTGSAAGWSGRGRLRLLPDTEMLTDPSTRFPAVLDPNFDQPDVGSEWAMVWSNGDDWWGEPAGVKPKVGYDGWSSAPKKSRSFYKFDIADLKGTQIQSAIFLHRQIHSPEHTCNTSGAGIEVWTVESFSSRVSWPGPAKLDHQDTNYKARGHEDYCSTNIENEWNVKPGLVSDLSNGYDRIRLGMYARDETNEMSWRHYSDEGSIYPRLQVVYNRAPNEPSNRSVGSVRKSV